MEILHFIFSSFWVWAGSTIMLAITAGSFAAGLGGMRGVLSYKVERHG